jgi:hypothetical protein
MTAKVIYNIGTHRVDRIDGDEIFVCRAGSQQDKEIKASDLRHYMGGDVAVPNLRLERGASAQRVSDLPNAEFDFREGDRLTGLQEGVNVNFSRMQILRSLLVSIGSVLDGALPGYTVATLPENPEAGDEAYVTDGVSGLSWGDEIKGGGSIFYKVWYNGVRYTVTGK